MGVASYVFAAAVCISGTHAMSPWTEALSPDTVFKIEKLVESTGATPQAEALALLEVLLVRPYVTQEQLENWTAQLKNGTYPRRALQAAPHSSQPAHKEVRRELQSTNDVVKPEAINGWIDTQDWRSFTSVHKRADGKPVQVHYVTAKGSGTRGGVVVSVGHTEPAEKYAEVIKDLIDEGYSPVWVLDHRGQGRSSRLLDDTFKSHVESFDHFVGDFRELVTRAQAEMGDGKLYMFCHSMGCAVGFSYLIEEYEHQRPNAFNAVAANAPLIQPVTDPFPYTVAVAIGQAMLLLGLGEEYPPTRGGTFDDFYGSPWTDRSTRQELHRQRCVAKQQHTYDAGHTGLCLGDPSARFAAEFFGTYSTFSGFTEGTLSIPILIQQANTNDDGHDGNVVNAPQAYFCSKSCDSCSLTKYADSTHNIWFEKGTIRSKALSEAFAFLASHDGDVVPQNKLPEKECSWWEFWCGW